MPDQPDSDAQTAGPAGRSVNRVRLVTLLSLVVFAIAIALIAHKGVQGPYYFDSNKLVPITDYVVGEAPDITQTRPFGDRLFGRIASMASFVAEAELSGGALDPRTSKTINILIHVLCGLLLFAFSTLALKNTAYRQRAALLSALAVGLWLLSPTNLGTAFYAIQRMAQLSALFVFTGLIAYVLLRSRPLPRSASAALLCAYLLSLTLAVTAKANGLLLIPLTFATEFFLFRFRNRWIHGDLLATIVAATGLISAAAVLIIRPELLDHSGRPFTLAERVLTQLRVIPAYVQDLLLPMEHSTGLLKQFAPSSGLLAPITTLLGLLAVVGYVVLIAICYRRGAVLIAFGLSFFALGHLLESTIFPLEMHFRHRNYMSSIGLYTALIIAGFDVAQRKQQYALMTTILAVYLVFMGAASYARATAWASKAEMAAAAYRYNADHYRTNLTYAQELMKAGRIDRTFSILDEKIRTSKSNELPYRLLHLYYSCILQRPVPEEFFQGLANARNNARIAELATGLKDITTRFADNECPSANPLTLVAALGQLIDNDHPTPINTWYINYYRAKILRESGHEQESEELLRALLDGGSKRAGAMLADWYLRTGRGDEATRLLDRMEKRFGIEDIDHFAIIRDRRGVEHGVRIERK